MCEGLTALVGVAAAFVVVVAVVVYPDEEAGLHLVAEQGEVRLVELIEGPHLLLAQQAVVCWPEQYPVRKGIQISAI